MSDLPDRITAYYAPAGYEAELERELRRVVLRKGRLFIAADEPQPVHWIQNLWEQPRAVAVDSINDAARKLKAVQRNWAHHALEFPGRESLIQAALPHVSSRPLDFLQPLPAAPMGAFTLLEKNLLLYSAPCSSPFPRGEVHFNEDKETPPGRAYLKLWELLTLRGDAPGPEDTVIDLGGSPGGWTWVLSELGCRQVISIDRAPLAPEIEARANVDYRKGDAFALDPLPEVTWVFSDVICEPERLYDLVQKWIQAGHTRFVCTLKFKGQADHATIAKFQAIPGARIQHLFANKHELTWTLGI